MTGLIAALGGVRASAFAAAALAGWLTVGAYVVLHARQSASHADYRTEVAQEREKAATELAEALAASREADQAHAQAIAELDAKYQQEIADAQANAERTIADLRSGALVLRKRLAAGECPAEHHSRPAGGRDDRAATGLRVEDAEFLVRESQRADQNTRQLSACQAYVRTLR